MCPCLVGFAPISGLYFTSLVGGSTAPVIISFSPTRGSTESWKAAREHVKMKGTDMTKSCGASNRIFEWHRKGSMAEWHTTKRGHFLWWTESTEWTCHAISTCDLPKPGKATYKTLGSTGWCLGDFLLVGCRQQISHPKFLLVVRGFRRPSSCASCSRRWYAMLRRGMLFSRATHLKTHGNSSSGVIGCKNLWCIFMNVLSEGDMRLLTCFFNWCRRRSLEISYHWRPPRAQRRKWKTMKPSRKRWWAKLPVAVSS